MRLFLILMVGSLMSALQVSAESFRVGAFGSYIFSDETEDVAGGGLEAKMPLTDIGFLSLRGSYFPGVDRSSFLGPVPVKLRADYAPLEAGLGLQATLADEAFIYAHAGLSYIVVESDIQVNGVDTPLSIENDLGWYAAVGLAAGEKVQWFIEAQYRTFTWSVEGEGLPPGLPAIPESDLDHIAVNLGVRTRW